MKSDKIKGEDEKGGRKMNKVDYFKTEADYMVFALVECNGETRKNLLGITPFCYKNKEYGKNKKEEIKEKIKNHPNEKQALECLEELNF